MTTNGTKLKKKKSDNDFLDYLTKHFLKTVVVRFFCFFWLGIE